MGGRLRGVASLGVEIAAALAICLGAEIVAIGDRCHGGVIVVVGAICPGVEIEATGDQRRGETLAGKVLLHMAMRHKGGMLSLLSHKPLLRRNPLRKTAIRLAQRAQSPTRKMLYYSKIEASSNERTKTKKGQQTLPFFLE